MQQFLILCFLLSNVEPCCFYFAVVSIFTVSRLYDSYIVMQVLVSWIYYTTLSWKLDISARHLDFANVVIHEAMFCLTREITLIKWLYLNRFTMQYQVFGSSFPYGGFCELCFLEQGPSFLPFSLLHTGCIEN